MKTKLVLVTVAALMTVLCCASIPARAADAKLGYVNMQRALENSAAGQLATKKLNDIWEDYKKKLQTDKDKLDALKSEIDKQSLLWNEKLRKEKEDELRTRERDYNRLLKDVQDDIKTKEQEFSENIGKDLLALVETIGKAEGYTMIFEKKASGIVFAPAAADLTDRLIKEYDAKKQ